MLRMILVASLLLGGGLWPLQQIQRVDGVMVHVAVDLSTGASSRRDETTQSMINPSAPHLTPTTSGRASDLLWLVGLLLTFAIAPSSDYRHFNPIWTYSHVAHYV